MKVIGHKHDRRRHEPGTKRGPWRPLAIVSLLLILMSAGVELGTVGTAVASSEPIQTTTAVNIRPGPSVVSGAPLAVMPAGTSPDYVCWTTGQVVGYVDVWMLVRWGGVEGYYASYYDNSSYQVDGDITPKYGIPQCPLPGQQQAPTPQPTVVTAVATNHYPQEVNPATVLWCTNTSSFCEQNVVGNVTQQTAARMVCWWPDRGSKWFFVILADGREGFVQSRYVSGQTPTPVCTAVNWLNVSNWAIARLGETQYQSGDGPDHPPGGYWSGFCLTFAGDAWAPWGGIGAPTNAESYPIDIWSWYLQHEPSLVHRTGTPPRGAMVLWASSPSHIAIALGDNMVVGTVGVGSEAPVSVYSDSKVPSMLGWIMPPQADPNYQP